MFIQNFRQEPISRAKYVGILLTNRTIYVGSRSGVAIVEECRTKRSLGTPF